jgi:methyl-accepting chemotaxis protein
MNEMAIGAENINKSMNEVNDVSSRNKDSISRLVTEVGKFKVA